MWIDKIKTFFGGTSELTDDFFDELCDILVEGDFGALLAVKTVDELRKQCRVENIQTACEAKHGLVKLLEAYLAQAVRPERELEPDALNAILLLGVNGVGKTTSAAKLAARYAKDGRPLLAAADTFRAAAIDQLKIHGERLGIRVVAHKQNADAAAVVHDALEAALGGGYNPLIADTAGRMHTKTALVDELSKISRVIERFASKASIVHKKYLVLDATTGGNALVQAETFHDAVKIDGVILTKFDSNARGGIVFSLAAHHKIPVLFVCDGERYENIHSFDAPLYARNFIQ